jgi:hypothetical protein
MFSFSNHEKNSEVCFISLNQYIVLDHKLTFVQIMAEFRWLRTDQQDLLSFFLFYSSISFFILFQMKRHCFTLHNQTTYHSREKFLFIM